MDTRSIGPYLIVIGLLFILVGGLAYFGVLGWFGRLPGDVRIERGSTRVYAPITSMIVVSIALSLILAILRRIL